MMEGQSALLHTNSYGAACRATLIIPVCLVIAVLAFTGCRHDRSERTRVLPTLHEIKCHVSVGMTQEEVYARLGEPPMKGAFSYRADNTEQKIVVLFYPFNEGQIEAEDTDTVNTAYSADSSPIPVVVKNGRVLGWGWELVERVSNESVGITED